MKSVVNVICKSTGEQGRAVITEDSVFVKVYMGGAVKPVTVPVTTFEKNYTVK